MRQQLTSSVSRSASRATIAVLVILATASCHHRPVNNTNNQSSKVIDADALLVNVADVERISGTNNLRVNPKVDPNRPRSPHSTPPGACQVLDPTVAFGTNWTQFRTSVYNRAPAPSTPAPPGTGAATAPAPTKPLLINQSVAVYPNDQAAQAVFARLAPALTACAAVHAKYYDFTVDQPDNSTVTLQYASGTKDFFQVKASVLTHVEAAGFAHSDQVAADVTQTISNRI